MYVYARNSTVKCGQYVAQPLTRVQSSILFRKATPWPVLSLTSCSLTIKWNRFRTQTDKRESSCLVMWLDGAVHKPRYHLSSIIKSTLQNRTKHIATKDGRRGGQSSCGCGLVVLVHCSVFSLSVSHMGVTFLRPLGCMARTLCNVQRDDRRQKQMLTQYWTTLVKSLMLACSISPHHRWQSWQVPVSK